MADALKPLVHSCSFAEERGGAGGGEATLDERAMRAATGWLIPSGLLFTRVHKCSFADERSGGEKDAALDGGKREATLEERAMRAATGWLIPSSLDHCGAALALIGAACHVKGRY